MADGGKSFRLNLISLMEKFKTRRNYVGGTGAGNSDQRINLLLKSNANYFSRKWNLKSYLIPLRMGISLIPFGLSGFMVWEIEIGKSMSR